MVLQNLPRPDLIYFVTGQVDGGDELDRVRRGQEKGVLALFRLIRALQHQGWWEAGLRLKVVTRGSSMLTSIEQGEPYSAAVSGLIGSLGREYPDVETVCLDVGEVTPETVASAVAAIQNEPAHRQSPKVAWRTGHRYVQALSPVDTPPVKFSAFRCGGVYVIVGGAGGIGRSLSEYLIRKYGARIAWIGRRPLDREIEQKLQATASLGGEVIYLQADVADQPHVESAFAAVRTRWGRIDGAVHSALVLRDRRLERMQEQDLLAALAPKTVGMAVLAQAAKAFGTDWLMVFSSVQSFANNTGQSNYAAASVFADAYARWAGQSLGLPVHVVNWGYWGSVGIVASERYRTALAEQGMGSIEVPEGMEAVERILAYRVPQLAVVRAAAPLLKELGVDYGRRKIIQPVRQRSVFEELRQAIASSEASKLNPGPEAVQHELNGLAELERLGRFALASQLSGLSLIPAVGELLDLKYLERRLEVIPRHQRLFAALIGLMARAGFIESTVAGWRVTEVLDGAESARSPETFARLTQSYRAAYPEFAGHAELLVTCVKALPVVLRGATAAAEVMFPGGSLRLVEKIYKGTTLADYFNRLAAFVLERAVAIRLADLPPGEKICVVEVGAGTGSTTEFVAAALERHGERIDYVYSDVSAGFKTHFQNHFAHRFPFMRFAVIDLERGLAEQGLNAGSADLVLAANAVHVASNLHRSLQLLKGLLKQNGLLMMIELTEVMVFNTLTYGLLDGWWHFEDGQRRLPSAPVLSRDQWQRALFEEGFCQVTAAEGRNGVGKFQSLFVAESDGSFIVQSSDSSATMATGSQATTALPTARTAAIYPEDHPPVVPPLSSAALTTDTTDDREHLQTLVEERVSVVLRKVLRLEAFDLSAETTFDRLGVDSIVGVTVVEALNQALGTQLRPVDLFNYSTTRSLSDRIVSAYGAIVRPHLPGPKRVAAGVSDTGDPDNPPGQESAAGTASTATMPKESEPAPRIPANIAVLNPEPRESLIVSERDDSYTPIAIVGMSGCFPEAANVEEFWANLAAGKDSVKEVSRWRLEDFYSEERGVPGRSYCKSGGFLSEIDKFDPLFFNISPHEAELMEPQHRLFLMESWRALEDAGYGNRELNGARCGVFVGCSGGDYEHVLRPAGRDGEAYSFMGMAPAILASRISYWLNLKGPSLAIDTACSSSGVAIHLACESLRLRTSDMALAGGVALMCTPRFHVLASQTEMLSVEGKCKTFSEGADGFVPGEAAAAVVLKRLADAVRDRDHLYGIIRGSAINQDGKTSGITAPSGPSQTALATEVYQRYGIHPETVSYVECHGTGTKIGDPIEIGALTDAFGRFTDKTGFCAVGSVKTNIGHTLMASAAASVIKVLLSLKRGQIPPSLHAAQTSPEIGFAGSPFYVNRLLTPWNRVAERPRRAAVSSFGFSGTNAHMVIEESPLSAPLSSLPKPSYLLTISARTDWSLRRRLEDLAGWLDGAEEREASLESISYTLNFGRSHFEKRRAVVVSSVTELREALGHLLADETPANALSGESGQISAADIALYREVQRAVLGELRSLSVGNRDEYREKLLALGGLYIKGFEIDWANLHRGESCRRLSLPTYPFNLERYWVDPSPLHPQLENPPKNEYFCLRSIWQPAPSPDPATERLPDNVLVFDEGEELAHNLAVRLPGRRLLRVIFGQAYQRSGNLVTLRVNSEEDCARLLKDAPPQVIVYRCSVANGSIEERLARGIEAAYCLSRSLIRTSPKSEIRFLFVHGSDAPPDVAAISALLQTAAEENPKIRVRTVIAEGAGDVLVNEVVRGDGAGEVRYRDGQREMKAFAELPPQNDGIGWFRPKGVYFITGGAGGLGGMFSEHLARNYQARLIWVGRSELATSQLERIEALRARGADVLYVRGDVTRREEVLEAVRQAKARFGTINGVIHAAGVLRNGFLLNKRIEDLRQVIAAKVYGTLNLDEALTAEPLDAFLLCSSIASVLPEAGQSDYAFANRFLDEFASRREELRARGLRSGRTMAINWQMWRDGGIIAGLSIEELQTRAEQTVHLTGLPALAPEQGIHLLERSSHMPASSGLFCYGNRKTLLQRIARMYGAPEKQQPETVPDERRLYAQTEAYVKTLVADLLKLPLDRFGTDTAFSEYGLDSILITRFNGRIAKDLPDVSKTLLFEYPNAAALSRHLVQAHRAGLGALFKEEEPELQAPAVFAMEPAVIGSAGASPRGHHEESVRTESCDIAIIGMAGRYPDAADLTAFWSNLKQGRNSVREIPPDRWEEEDLYDPDPAKASQGKLYCKWGGFVEGVDEFDAQFFNISPAEAETMDPQERLFLETAWHAFEDAGYARSQLSRWLRKEEQEKVGVFVGVTHNSYQLLGVLRNTQQPTRVDHSGEWSLANRVSYFFNFCGPSLPVDTACSASLSAIHLACESLRSGECQVALTGGVNLHLNPSKFVNACTLGMLSPTGRCHSFGAEADGYVPGEGVGAVVLKPLDQAEKDGDFIYGVIKASAINHGGRTNGFSVPNPAAQADVIAQTLRKAGLDPRSISYLEAHGTGTELGDPIEVDGLTKAFTELLRERNVEAPSVYRKSWCALGSVKSNIGHLEAAAGIAGLTKILLQMRHRQLVPSLHAESVNPNIDFTRTPFVLQQTLGEWVQPTVDGTVCPRRAGISSFGAGGSNAHLIVEEYDDHVSEVDGSHSSSEPVLILLSARGESQLKQAAITLLNYLQQSDAGRNWRSQKYCLYPAGRPRTYGGTACLRGGGSG